MDTVFVVLLGYLESHRQYQQKTPHPSSSSDPKAKLLTLWPVVDPMTYDPMTCRYMANKSSPFCSTVCTCVNLKIKLLMFNARITIMKWYITQTKHYCKAKEEKEEEEEEITATNQKLPQRICHEQFENSNRLGDIRLIVCIVITCNISNCLRHASSTHTHRVSLSHTCCIHIFTTHCKLVCIGTST